MALKLVTIQSPSATIPSMTTVQIACETKDSLPLDRIEPLQGDLKSLSTEDLEKLCGEIMETGFAFPVLVWKDARVKRVFCIGGHQRVKALEHLKTVGWPAKKGGAPKPVEVPRVPVVYVQAKSLKEAKRRVLQDVSQYGKVTTTGLKEFALGAGLDLAAIFGDFRLPDIDVVNFISGSAEEAQELYTKKVEGPVYTPKGEKPAIADLCDFAKTQALLDEIDESNLSEYEKMFLTYAAYRHIVFDYENIAEFYAHSSKEMQGLMENSALVIIDFKKALEKGFVKLSEKIAATYADQEDDEDPDETPVVAPAEAKKSSILDAVGKADLEDLIARCLPLWSSPVSIIKLKSDALQMLDLHKNGSALPPENGVAKLLKRWYDSIKKDAPAYSVYSDPFYLADVWTCWVEYSRKSVQAIASKNSMITHSLASVVNPKGLIVDAGCGIAYTTAALKEMFPESRVVGTNIKGTWQYALAEGLAKDAGFEMLPGLDGLKDVELLFASEYFEHMQEPIEHLEFIVSTCRPKYMVIANGFNGTSIGHFNEYRSKSKIYTNTEMSKLFWKSLRELGYEKQATKIWNNRPSIWVRK